MGWDRRKGHRFTHHGNFSSGVGPGYEMTRNICKVGRNWGEAYFSDPEIGYGINKVGGGTEKTYFSHLANCSFKKAGEDEVRKVANRVFHRQKMEILAILASDTLLYENKKIQQENVTTVRSLNCLLFLHHFNLSLDHLVHINGAWPYKDLTDLPSNKCLSEFIISKRLSSILTGVTFCC